MGELTALQRVQKFAAKNFQFSDPEFHGFNSVKSSDFASLLVNDGDLDLNSQLEIWADFSLAYTGEPPQSYRTINTLVMDWVDNNEDKIKKEVNPSLKEYLNKEFPDIDTKDLDDNFDDYIWEDQIDYMPEIEEEKKRIRFSIEIVLDVEEDEDEEK